MLVHVDDILHLAHDLKEYMDAFNCTFILKEESVGTPERDI